MKTNQIVYQLNSEDVQCVAIQEMGRKLTKMEIKQIKNCIAENIDWYDAIAVSIGQNLDDEFHRNN